MEPTKAQQKNYRKSSDLMEGCATCIKRQAVPWLWCPEVGQQVIAGMTCDQHLEVKANV